ncbi:cilia- and flagella-associated protein 99-like [Liolophura sinensis]|uniref:cilia- and flagella-associated protein 99-like n=1 Tax=Liolophura sinensis TaxID=3198878 RepID=UPI0031593CB2
MSSGHKKLLQHCICVLDTYQPEIQSTEDHITNYFDTCKNLTDSDANFITEVFSGCARYGSIMKVVTNTFYVKDGKKILRSEENLYTVICYLAVFRLDELGMSHFRKFVFSQDVNKMYKFLNFFFDERNLLTWIKDEWHTYYEATFVQTALMSPLLGWLPELIELVEQLKDRVENKTASKKTPASITQPKPFNITQPRPRAVPVPERIPKLKKHRPVPKTIYTEPQEFGKIASTKVENRRQAEERLMEAHREQFACANWEKSDKTKQILESIMVESDQKLDFDRHRANPVPTSVVSHNCKHLKERGMSFSKIAKKGVPIKLNTAAILREGKLYKERQDQEIKRLEKLEAGARDPSEFLKWQSEMRQKDLDAELLEIEKRRLEGKLSHEEAILARQNIIQENKQKVLNMKEEAHQMMQEYLEQRFKEEQEMRQLVEDTMMGHKNAKEAKKKLQEYKQKIVQEVNEESKELMKQALEEAEEEMRRKMELIHQIRAMEAVPIIRQKFVDLTESSGAGFLGEMSIVELRERLALLKTANEEEEEMRRDEILAAKQAKNQNLMDTLEMISKHRVEKCKAASEKLEEKKRANTQPSVPKVKDDKLLELQKRLEEKKAERRKEQEKSKLVVDRQSSKKTQGLIKQKKEVEEKRWKELELTRERTSKLQSQGILGSRGVGRLTNNSIVMTT